MQNNFGDKAICNNLGVGDKLSKMQIHYGKHDVSHSFVHDKDLRGGEEVNITTIDKYCKNLGIEHINLLKIDIEGFEPQVIDGAIDMLKKQKVDLLLVELGLDPNGYYVYYPSFADKLRAFGYHTLGFYDQTCKWDGSAELLFCNVLFAREGLTFVENGQ